MTKTKSIGTEYQIVIKSNWGQVAEAVRTTKQLIENTQSKPISFSLKKILSEDIELENRILKAYLVPKEGESFASYKNRFVQTFIGGGLKGKLASLLYGKKVPFSFRLTQNDGESILKIHSETKEEKYQATISASGYYSKRGESIANSLKEFLEQKSVQHKYKTLDKLI